MSFFSHIEAFFKNILGSTSWEQTASNTLTLVSPLLETIVALSAGDSAAASVQSVVTQVQSDLATVSSLVNGYKSGSTAGSGAQITSILESIKSNLGSLLSAGHINNTETLAKVTAIVNTVVGEVEAILKVLPPQS